MDPSIIIKEEPMMDCDVAETAKVLAESGSHLEKTKKRKRKKIRRLAETENSTEHENPKRIGYKRIFVIASLLIFTIALLMGHYLTQNNSNKSKIIKEFLKNYKNQYSEIVHGKSNYCDPKQQFETSTLFTRVIQNKILHQEQAIQKIALTLRNESNLNAVVLVGAVGVGKSLFIRAFHQIFPWQENVHIYSWNTYVDDEAKKFNLIRTIIDSLSDCGQNLLVIENLLACDHAVVPIINKLVIEAIKHQQKRVLLFYVFRLNTMLSAEAYAVEKDLLQSLPNCNVINFKKFSYDELKDCIRREAELENIALTKKDFDEIVETIDPSKSGCKNVNAKVLMYGKKIKTKDEI